ncbi:MAG: CreA family protein [Pseudomonadota bacterium]
MWKSCVFRLVLALLVLGAGSSGVRADGDAIGSVDTAFKLIGRNHQIRVQAFDDPKLPGVRCYVSQAVVGGISGSLGLAEDPSQASIACRQVAPIAPELVAKLPTGREGELVFSDKLSPLFKELRVTRMVDRKANVLVYLIWSTKLIDGSPMNSVTAVPLYAGAR